MRRARAGNALVLVISVLAALIAIAVPFAMSMRLQDRTARGFAAGIRAEQAARAARDLAVLKLVEGHPAEERKLAEAKDELGDSSEDWDGSDELGVDLAPLPGATGRLEPRDPRGTLLSVEVEDEQGKVNLNSASALLLGNLLGVAELADDMDADSTEIHVAGDAPFFSDGNRETYDGVLRIGRELIVYKHVESTDVDGAPISVIAGLERGAFFSAPERGDLVHKKDDFVHDARALKLALTPFWLDLGGYRPYLTVTAAREIASWQLVDFQLAELFRRGVTPELLESYGLGGEVQRALAVAHAAAPSPTAGAADDEPAPEGVAGKLVKQLESGKLDPAEVADRALQRMGRADGKKWLERVMDAVGGAAKEGDARQFVESVKARLRQAEEYERKYFGGAAAQAARLAEARDLEALSARELERLRGAISVASVRPAEWAGGAAVTGIGADGRQQHTVITLGVDIPEARNGAAVRIDEPNGRTHYRHIRAYQRSRGRAPPKLFVFPQVVGPFAPGTVRVYVAPAHPVNVNTAPVRVLEALLTGLRGNTQFGHGHVTRAKAAAVARNMASVTLKGPAELAGLLILAVGAQEITQADAAVIMLNALDPGSPGLQSHTAPFAFAGAEVATVRATGTINDPAGNELARHVLREVVSVAPPREAAVELDSQLDFFAGFPDSPIGRTLRQGRRSGFIETLPIGLDVVRSGGVAFPSRSHQPGVGELILAHGRVPDAGQAFHFDDEPEGQKLGPADALVTDTSQFASAVKFPWPFSEFYGLTGLLPGSFEMWFRPSWSEGFHVFFDTGPDSDTRNRLTCFYDPQRHEVVLQAYDAAIDEAEPRTFKGDPRPAEVRLPAQFQADRWYHIAASWKGSRAGELAVFVDGLARGLVESHATRLTADLPPGGDRISVEDGSELPKRGVVLVGNEAIEYDNSNDLWAYGGAAGSKGGPGQTGAVLQARIETTVDPKTQQQMTRRAGRRSRSVDTATTPAKQAQTHPAGTPVQIFGYTDFLMFRPEDKANNFPGYAARVPPGEARLDVLDPDLDPLPLLTPKALVYAETVIPAPGGKGTPKLGVDKDVTEIPIISDDRFPATDGVVQIGKERIRYAAAEPPDHPEKLSGCRRGWDGTTAEPHLTLENVILCDLKVRPGVQNFDDQGTVQLTLQREPLAADPQPEWVRVRKPSASDGRTDRFFLEHGNTGRDWGSWEPGDYRARARFRAQAAWGAWQAEEKSRARERGGTTRRAHMAAQNEPVIGTWRTEHAFQGRTDWVTITDGSNRVERRICWVDDGDRRAAFTDFVDVEFAGPVARLVKRPSGELPTRLSASFSIGRRRADATDTGPPGNLEARIDELRLAGDATPWAKGHGWDNAEAYGARCAGGVESRLLEGPIPQNGPSSVGVRTERYVLLRPDGTNTVDIAPQKADELDTSIRAAAQTAGLLLKIDDEILGATSSSGGTIAITARGLLGTNPAAHEKEARVYVLPWPPIARLGGGLAGPDGGDLAATGARPAFGAAWQQPGYVAFDAENGAGVTELFPYERVKGGALERPLDDRGRGAYRGCFGTDRGTPLAEGRLAIGFPFRFFDRHEAALESDDAVYWQATLPAAGGSGAGAARVFRSVEWDEKLPNGAVEIVILARVDGSPGWDERPTNAPGGIFRFDNPADPNRIDVAGRALEVRAVFPFRPGAYRDGAWKETPRLGGVRVHFIEPVRALASEEADR